MLCGDWRGGAIGGWGDVCVCVCVARLCWGVVDLVRGGEGPRLRGGGQAAEGGSEERGGEAGGLGWIPCHGVGYR